ncbi:polyhydroxyalkanoate synthesis repressor PhaR [Cohaesibacter gelatinilyticus]|uniref:Polyhydroxyalkanoate synthesis repressor PhaR n=1 Tax=Cohaesibacter gelatinilyticus TaxID=372072 RepID=A0A285PGF4_9HYPH|nr:polyhydroxyalkanoate synthesis repressor PhaR [Cohaesibacter gelatinilyticus]SNZ20774.1 polyhydroxyalkanoate synthesis repressor PhaR [Cohaesibacter gelatinilyticus]
MTDKTEQTVIKKYANRRLYNTGTSTYVTLEDLSEMVKAEEDFVVFDAKSGDDITRSVLTQIIFEHENKGQNLLPIAFLRQLIRFYGDSMQTLVPSYLEFSMDNLTKDQDNLRKQLSESFGNSAFDAMEEQVRRNTEMFENAMKMFMPFGAAASPLDAAMAKPAEPQDKNELDALKEQMADMQKMLSALANKKD